MTTRIRIEPGGSRPPFAQVAKHLWGDVDFDSDGNSSRPEDTDWTELILTNRSDESQRIDVDPVSESPLQLEIRSESAMLAEKTALFLVAQTHGKRVK